MKKYVVAYVSFFENELEQKIVEAENKVEAFKLFMREKYKDKPEYLEEEIKWQESDDYPDIYEELVEYLYNGDLTMSVIEI